MATRRLRWQGSTRAEQCRQALLVRVERWLADWSADAPAAQLRGADDAGVAVAAWRSLGRGGARVWLGTSADAPATLAAALAALAAPDRRELAAGLGRRALADLLQRLLPAGHGGDAATAAPDADDIAPRFGGLTFAGTGALEGVVVVLDLGACDALVPPAPIPALVLAPRASAIAGESVPLDVVVGLGDVALADASGLRVGEVLLAGPLRDLAVTLRAPAGAPLMTGALTRAGDRMAVSLQSRTP
jgi:hypothetical protein